MELCQAGPWIKPEFWEASTTFEETNLADAHEQLQGWCQMKVVTPVKRYV